MVRLIANDRTADGRDGSSFQFQYGAINSLILTPALSGWFYSFQFQYGAINSKGKRTHPDCSQFQFQYGAINRIVRGGVVVDPVNFNSNMVRLIEFVVSNKFSIILISIPIWCD